MGYPLFLLALSVPCAASAATQAPPSLETLLNQLSHAGSPEEDKPIEDKIRGIFMASGSASVDLLMTRGAAALAAGNKDVAKQIYEAVTDIAPNYAEGWHSRAALQRQLNDDSGAIVSLEHVILINPRQFA